MNNNRDLFEKASIPKAVTVMGIPTIISMLVVVIYNMADTFFIGKTNDAMQVAAVSLATPVFMILLAFGNLFGIGGSSSLSRAMGEKNEERVKNISSFCFYSSIGFGIFIMAVFLLAMNVILKSIGASANTIGFAEKYITYITIGAPFIIVSNAFANIVRAEGAAKESMIGNLIGTVVNIVLDPIMILVLDLGVAGAAIATVIGNIAACGFYLGYILKRPTMLSINPKYFKADSGIATGVLSIGIPASLNTILMSIANIVLNNVLGQYGDSPVAAMGVALKANMLVVMLQIGLCMGIQPLIGYNYGAANWKRLKRIFTFTAFSTIVLGTVMTIIMVIARESIIRAFINDSDVIEQGIKMMISLQISGPLIGILFLCINTIQGMGKALPSLILTVCRQGLIFIPMVFLLNSLFELEGVIYAQPVTDYLTIVLSLVICIIIFRKLEHGYENNIK